MISIIPTFLRLAVTGESDTFEIDTFFPEERLGRVGTTDVSPFGILPMIRLESTTLYFFTGSYRV
jgi:hypothetical protein